MFAMPHFFSKFYQDRQFKEILIADTYDINIQPFKIMRILDAYNIYVKST